MKSIKFKIDQPILILLIVGFILFIPSLFEPISYGDECIYLTLGNALRKGLVFYRDIHDNKPPLLYFVAALSDSRLFWFRLINIVWSMLHFLIICKLIKKLTKKKFFSFLGGSLFLFFYLLFEGRIANGENFMMMPITLAVYLLFTSPQKKNFFFGLLIGSLFGLSFLFKIPVVFDFVGIILASFIFSLKSVSIVEIKKTLKEKRLWGIISGFLFPIVVTIIYYSIKDAATPYIRSALLQNIGYLSSWQGSNSGLILRFAVVLFSSIVLFCLRRKMSFTQLFFLLWFIFSLFGALLSGRPYPHYLIEIVPSIAILTAITISEAKTNYRRIYPLLFAFILFFFSYFGFKFWRYPQLPYYKNFISFSTHKISREEYFSFWGNKTAENYQLANFIRLTTNPEEKIFVWGDAACVYALSNRLPTSKYTVNYHIFDFDALEETLETIKKEKPRLIIKLKEEKRPWSQLDSYLQKFYYPYGLLETEDEIFIRRL